MCFFDQTRWACGFWRWGNLRQRCTKEHRIGETCGLKLIFETHNKHDHCKRCELVIRKQRRITKMKKDIARWRREGSRLATIEKTERDLVEVQRSISTLWDQHNKQHIVGSGPYHRPRAAWIKPPVTTSNSGRSASVHHAKCTSVRVTDNTMATQQV